VCGFVFLVWEVGDRVDVAVAAVGGGAGLWGQLVRVWGGWSGSCSS